MDSKLPEYRKQVIDNFISFATKDEHRAPLFATIGHCVTTEMFNGYRIIRRSTQIESLLDKVVKSVKGNDKSQGFLYFLHQMEDSGRVHPLYLGIARRTGKKNEISTLFNASYPRWGHYKDGNFHLSSLNAVVFRDGYSKSDYDKYKGVYLEWAEMIFDRSEFPIGADEKLCLRMPVYLSVIEWDENKVSFVDVLGNTTIKCEESILINLLYDYYPDMLLNKEI